MQVILRHKGKDPWANVVKYKNCFDYIAPYWTRSGSKYTGLNDEDAARLEKAIGYPAGHLSATSPYWVTFAVKLTEKEIVLDTDIPIDELKYLFLKGHKRVAGSLTEIKASTDYVLINKESEAQESNKVNRARRQALREFDKMSLDEMRRCLRLYGYRSDTMSAELIENRLTQLIEENPPKFFSKWVDNKVKNTEFLVEQAISKNVLRKSRNVYYHGTDIIGNSLEDAIGYLDNPANQDLRLTIQKETESK